MVSNTTSSMDSRSWILTASLQDFSTSALTSMLAGIMLQKVLQWYVRWAVAKWFPCLINGLKLSIFWPYKVISEIASQCVVNQDKQKTMIPVLRQLGGLAKLGISHDGKSTTLLGHYLQALISQSELDFLRVNVSAIASLFKMCCSSPVGKANIITNEKC